MNYEVDQQIKLNATHSHINQRLAELRFYKLMKIYEVKDILSKKFGTLPELLQLKVIKQDGTQFSINDDDTSIKDYNIDEFDTFHVIDLNPNSTLVQNNFDDVSGVQKYEISEEDYNKRDDSVRKFKKKLMTDTNYVNMIKENQGPSYEEEAKKIEIGKRCLLGDGFRRGEVVFVGKVSDLGFGYWIGVKLDEPVGDTNGK